MSLRGKEIYTDDLFGLNEKTKRRNDLYRSVDSILKKQGSEAVFLGSSMRSHRKHNDREDPRSSFIANLPFPYLGEVN